jgi:hypothetical protein
MMKTRILLLMVFVFLASACAAPGTSQPAVETVPPTIEIQATSEPTLLPATAEAQPAMQTYTDDFAGFSLDYPAGWSIDPSAAANAEQAFAYSVPIATWDLRNPPTPGGKDLNTMPEGATKIDVSVTMQAMTLEEAVAQQEQNESGSPILAREDVTLAGGLPAVILDVEGFAGLTRTLITVLNGNVIYISGYGNLENFEAIALTLRAR